MHVIIIKAMFPKKKKYIIEYLVCIRKCARYTWNKVINLTELLRRIEIINRMHYLKLMNVVGKEYKDTRK